MSNRRRGRKKKGSILPPILLGLLGILMIIGMVVAKWWIGTIKIKVDPTTNCPLEGPRAVHVIMIDRSDPITEQQAQRVRQVMQEFKVEAALGTRFDIYTVEGDTQHELAPVLTVCAPGKASEASQFFQNPVRMQRIYEERFSKVLDGTVDELLRASTRPDSPIAETLRAAALTSFGSFNTGGVPLRLTVVSDMVQHSASFSNFRSEPNFPALEKSPAWASIRPKLNDVETKILYVLRPTAARGGKPIQNRGHQTFWEQFISAAGGRLENIEPL